MSCRGHETTEADTYNPVSNPPSIFEHGESKDDCVTVWFFALLSKEKRLSEE